MSWDYEYFSEKEMACRCGCGCLPEDSFMQILMMLREQLGFPMPVTSGCRCADYNAQVSGSGRDGPHVRRVAADIHIFGQNARNLLKIALDHGISGIGINLPNGKPINKHYLHLDTVPIGDLHIYRPAIWSYGG